MALDLMSASESTTNESYRFESSRSSESTSSPQKIAPTISQPGVDRSAIETAVRTILRAVGEDVNRDGLLDTPARVARMYEEMFAGLHLDPARHLETTFPEDYDEIVLVRDIPFTSMCEHHLLPFTGVAHVGYLPNGRVVGLSKLARVVEEVARRPQVQERMTQTVADMLEEKLGTKGAAVVIESEHSCMALRGVRKAGTLTVTSSLRGIFRTSPASRAEILSLINGK
jgi:GTP cyclohydrolase IA